MVRFALVGLLLCAGLTSAAEPTKPATLAEVRQVINWLTFPKPDGAVYEQTSLLTSRYMVAGEIDPMVEWTRKAFAAAGWAEEKRATPDAQPDKYRSLQFVKNGFLVNQFISAKSQSVEVNFTLVGNVDARQLPKPDNVTAVGSDRSYQSYTTTETADAVTAFCRKVFTAGGWRETPSLGAAAAAKEGRVELRFVQNAMECRVMSYLDDKKSLTVMYHTAVRSEMDPAEFAVKAVPTPAGEKEKLAAIDLKSFPRIGELDAKVNTGTRLEYGVYTGTEKAVAFYRKAFADKGWTQVPPLIDVFDKGELHFEKDGFSVEVALRRNPNGGLVTCTVTNHGNVDTRHLPHPPGAEFSPIRKPVFFIQTTATPAEAEAFYRKELPKLGWKEKKDTFVAFEQNGVTLRLIVGTPRQNLTPVQVTLVSDK